MTNEAPCDTCDRSTLSLLFLRPSPVARKGRLVPAGADAVHSEGLAEGLVPQRQATESRTVLRLLRPGYVHIHIPAPPKGVKPWLVFRITSAADCLPDQYGLFQMANVPTCRRPRHNPMGARLIPIPQAHLINEIWVAYSANLWDDALKARNAANPNAMQRVSLRACGKNEFTPTAELLTTSVLEFALPRLMVNGAADHDFPFASLFGQAKSMVDQMERAAASHRQTAGLQKAVVLADPVGYASELNALRLRRNELLEQFMLRPQNRHPIEVNKVISLLKNNLLAHADEQALNHVVPLRTEQAYKRSSYPPGTQWQPLSAQEKALHARSFEQGNWLGKLIARPALERLSQDDVGRVILPDYEARAQAWAQQQAAEDWERFTEFYDEGKRAAWEQQFEQTVKTEHLDELARYEQDWSAALQDASLRRYFEHHFDPAASCRALDVAQTGCCPGTTYLREVSRAHTPQPNTDSARAAFEAQLDADVTQPDALLLRALFANQASLWQTMEDSKRDKVYDFMKGLIGEFTAAATAGATRPMPPSATRRLAWLTDANMGYALGIVGTAGAVALRGVHEFWQRRSVSAAAPAVDAQLLARLHRAESMALIHRACEEALKAADGKAFAVPVLLMANVSVETYTQIQRARGHMLSLREFRGLKRKGQITLGILTDTQTAASLRVSPDKAVFGLATDAANSVHINEHAIRLKGAVVQQAGAAGGALTLPVSRFLPLYETQILAAAAAPKGFTAWLSGLASQVAGHAHVQHAAGAAMSMDGRLAVGTMIVQGLGFYSGLQQYMAATSTDKSIDALLSMADGGAGVLGGAAELGAKWLEVRLGASAEASARLAAARAVAALMGVAGNAVNAWMAFREAGKLSEGGQVRLATVMTWSGYTFVLGAAPLALQFAHQITLLALRKGATSAGLVLVERQLGKVVAARLGTATVGLTVPGIGWALTAVAVAETIYVVVNTPSEVEAWLKYCYFGKPGRGESTRKSWEEEDKAWKAIQAAEQAEAA